MVALSNFLFLHKYLHFPLTYFSIVSSTTDLSLLPSTWGKRVYHTGPSTGIRRQGMHGADDNPRPVWWGREYA